VFRLLSASAVLVTALASCGPPCAGRHPVEVEVRGLDGELRVTLRSDGLSDGSTTSLTFTEDGTRAFADDLECGAPYELAVESDPSTQRCQLVSASGTSGPDRRHLVECFTLPATCAELFVEPARIVDFEEAFDGQNPWPDPETFMTSLTQAPHDDAIWYAGSMQGAVARWDGSGWTEVLDLRIEVDDTEEDGFLSIVLPPDFPEDPRLFTHYIVDEPDPRRIRISHFTLAADGLTFDPASETPVLEVPKSPMRNSHAGGKLLFGPDGMLWGAFGDGGVNDEPPDNAQDTSTLLGSMFRVDVSGAPPYAPAPDNIFAAEGTRPGEGRPEIWAWGFRNPYRWGFDSLTGAVWVGDVGHLTWEEINLVEAGHNYGWPVREGPTCYGTQDDACPSEGLTPPVHAYAQDVGDAVIGGVVYRGSAIPDLYGAYVFTDYGSRQLMALFDPYDTPQPVTLAPLPLVPVDITEDERGELLIAGFDGSIVRVVPATSDGVLPERLSETGCVRDGAPGELDDVFIPYDVITPLWSDGADKNRWLALPPGQKATADESGDLSFPVGSVLAKDFSLAGRLLETRFLLHRTPGRWAGYSYRWSPDGSEATLVTEAVTEELADQTWFYPGPDDCTACHTEAAGRSLGPSLPQLAAQIDDLVAAGVIDPPSAPPVPFVAIDDETAPLNDRARAYLHANCAHCHQPDNPIRASIDLRFDTPLADTALCEAPQLADFDLPSAQLLAPGEPDRSVLLHRMEILGDGRMPRLATSMVDETAVDVVRRWIASLSTCE
jgi:uncharacterized repeat protein (TIGR03806 family)